MDRQRRPSLGLGISTATISTPRLKQSIPKQIDVPSFSSFQAQTPRVTDSPVRRKPLPATASPVLPQLSSGGAVVAVGEEESDGLPYNSAYLDDPPPTAHHVPWLPTLSTGSHTLLVRDLDQYPRGQSPAILQSAQIPALTADYQRQVLQSLDSNASSPTRAHHTRIASDPVLHEHPKQDKSVDIDGLQRAATMSIHPGRPGPLHLDANIRNLSKHTHESQESSSTFKPRPPGPNKLTSFFGWRTSSPVAESSPIANSERSHSPVPSPHSPAQHSLSSSTPSLLPAIDVSKANAPVTAQYFTDTGLSLPPAVMSIQVGEMEDELREISSELAGSIRREMELEDLVERLQYEATQAPELSRRTSDYFSDSGTSSIRYPLSEVGGSKAEDLQKMKRTSEQEMARVKLDTSQKLQDERERRKGLELHIQNLEEHVQQINQERAKTSGTTTRVRELESSLEDVRRRLLEERQVKENFEDLLTALRGEIEQHRNERDNLRDEVVPQLRARLDVLETEATEFEKLTYENTRMQQELQSLKDENTASTNTRKIQQETQNHSPRFNSIAEEGSPLAVPPSPKIGLSRSNTVARNSGMGGGASKTVSIGRSNSVSTRERESRDSLSDRVRDIEMQRDALHRALKSLLDRQNYQNREHEKKLRALEQDRDRLLQAQSPRRMGYEMEVKGLRNEINHLRRRADDALEQKWRCEKGLGGLKMDLDRAEQETSSLRTLLHENDILVPELPGQSPREVQADTHANSASLERAFKELQETQASSIARLKELRGQAPTTAEDTNTAETMDLLLKSMSDAGAGEYHGLAEQLRASADRIEALPVQVRHQLEANSTLRGRLTEAISRGEREQKASATRINTLQGRLKTFEDKLMIAQQHSEDAVAAHEDEVQQMRSSHNAQLLRLKGSALKPP
ncbi:MAG: hypothetical protein LQ347_004723, partial [Umbilicaria vellea]